VTVTHAKTVGASAPELPGHDATPTADRPRPQSAVIALSGRSFTQRWHDTAVSVRSNPAMLWAQLVTAGLVLAYVASLLFVRRPHSGYTTAWDGWVGNIASLLPIVLIAMRVRSTAVLRGAWIAMGAGVLLYNVANLVYFFHDQNLHPIPAPAPSDVPYLLSYVAFVIGVAMMTQRAFGAVRVSIRLDGAITGLAIGAAAGMVWFDPILKVSGRPLEVAVGMSYPLFDLVLLVLLVSGLAPMHYRPDRSTALLMMGMTSFVIGDVIYLNQVAAGTYVGGTPLESTWAIGIWLIGLAAWPRLERRAAPRTKATGVPSGISLVPIVFGAISVVVLAASLVHPTSKVTLLMALGAICLVIVRMGLTLRDVKVVEQRSFQVARVDELTGLSNRRAFFEESEERITSMGRDGTLGFVLIDLDGFKEINDSLGHACGDDLLRVVAKRFQRSLANRGTVARIGGDEFACICEVGSPGEAVAIGETLVASLQNPISLDGVTVRVGASLGISVFPDHGDTQEELLRCADVAMYEAKHLHTPVRVYNPDADMHTRDRLAMIDDLREAIDARALTLHFQPTLDLKSGSVHGVEALVRWRHPTFGLLYPEDFVPLAERIGLINSMSRLVLELAAEELVRLDRAGHRLQMSVNLSRHDLLDEGLAAFIDEVLANNGVAAARLTLEITESSLGEDPALTKASIERLRARGIRISIDDFGVGYSSLSQLLELTVDELKIDKSFVLALSTDERARAVIGATIQVARALHLDIVAEGIESSQSLKAVHELGIDIAQGYFIACPFTTDQLDEFLMHPDSIVAHASGPPGTT